MPELALNLLARGRFLRLARQLNAWAIKNGKASHAITLGHRSGTFSLDDGTYPKI